MVTEKNKEQFEKWLNNYLLSDENGNLIYTDSFGNNSAQIEHFYEFKFEMQIGVYLAYYDSLGYVLDVMYIFSFEQYTFELENKNGNLNLPFKEALFDTRNEAYQEAFKQADKLTNNKLK